MENVKIEENRLVPDIRPENIETITETYTPSGGGGEQTATYKIINVHPIINGILDKLAFFRTHAAAVWYNKLGNVTLKQKLDAMDEISGTKVGMINTSKVLKARTFTNATSTYSATQNCWVQLAIKAGGGTGGNATINDVQVASFYTEGSYTEFVSCYPLKKGDVLKVTGNSTYQASYVVYGSH